MRRPVRVRRPPRSNEWLEGLPDRERHAAETLIQQVGVAGLDRVAAAYIQAPRKTGRPRDDLEPYLLEMASLMIENGWTKNCSAEAVARRVLDRGEWHGQPPIALDLLREKLKRHFSRREDALLRRAGSPLQGMTEPSVRGRIQPVWPGAFDLKVLREDRGLRPCPGLCPDVQPRPRLSENDRRSAAAR